MTRTRHRSRDGAGTAVPVTIEVHGNVSLGLSIRLGLREDVGKRIGEEIHWWVKVEV